MSHDQQLIDTIKTYFARKSSAQLQEIVQATNHDLWSPEAMAAADELLQDRRDGRAQEPQVVEKEKGHSDSSFGLKRSPVALAGEPIEREYPLTLSSGRTLAMVGCVVVVTVGCVWMAVSNSNGLHFPGIVTLSAVGATVFYWLLAAACGLFALPLTLAVAWRATFLKQWIVFTRSSIWIPRTNWSEELVEVSYEEIASASVWSFKGERVVTLVLARRKFRIGQSWLPSPTAFDEVLARLNAGMQTAEQRWAER